MPPDDSETAIISTIAAQIPSLLPVAMLAMVPASFAFQIVASVAEFFERNADGQPNEGAGSSSRQPVTTPRLVLVSKTD